MYFTDETLPIKSIKPYARNAKIHIEEKWVCQKCGKELYQKPYKNETCICKGRYKHYKKCNCGEFYIVKDNEKFCSARCRGYELSKRQKPIEITCKNCGKVFVRYVGNVNKNAHNLFCSKECSIKFRKGERITRECKHCGKEFTIYKSSLKTNASGNYCSKRCYWNDMTVPKKGYNGFGAAKRLYFGKEQICAICGTTNKIHIHHIIPNRLTQDQSKENLIPLCARHHIMIERETRDLLAEFTDYKILHDLLNNVLRQRQAETEIAKKRVKDAVKDRIQKN